MPGSSFIKELVNVIVETCKIVPKGILCFVSSYKVLTLIKTYIMENSLNNVDTLQKVVFLMFNFFNFLGYI